MRPSIIKFSALMEEKLLRNDKIKQSWKRTNVSYLLKRLKDEVKELEDALDNDNEDIYDVAYECADVANFAMMIADNLLYPKGTIYER